MNDSGGGRLPPPPPLTRSTMPADSSAPRASMTRRASAFLWRHPRVIVTPHVAATTLAEPSVRQIVANLQRLAAGEPLSGVVDRARGY